MAEEVASIYAELKIATDNAKKVLKEFADQASKTQVEVDVTPSKKSQDNVSKALGGQAAKKGAGILDGVFSGLTNGLDSLKNLLKGVGGAISIAAVAVISLMKGTDTFNEITKELKGVFDALQKSLAPIIALLGEILIPVIQLLQKVFTSIGNNLSRTLVPILTVVADVIKVITDVLDTLFDWFESIADWIYKLLGWDKMQRPTSTTGTKAEEGYSSSLDIWETTSTEDQIADNTALTVDGIDNVIDELKDNGLTEEEINARLREMYNLTQDQVDALMKTYELNKQAAEKAAEDAARPQGIFDAPFASKDLGFGAGLFTSKGRWGDGYQFGDILGSLQDFSWGLLGKGWLWEKGGTLPTYADGGNVGAQIWGMNEAGNPEFLFNSGGYDSVINANALEEAMYNALMRAGKGNKAVQVNVTGGQADVRQLVRWLLPALKLELGGLVAWQ